MRWARSRLAVERGIKKKIKPPKSTSLPDFPIPISQKNHHPKSRSKKNWAILVFCADFAYEWANTQCWLFSAASTAKTFPLQSKTARSISSERNHLARRIYISMSLNLKCKQESHNQWRIEGGANFKGRKILLIFLLIFSLQFLAIFSKCFAIFSWEFVFLQFWKLQNFFQHSKKRLPNFFEIFIFWLFF